MNDKVIISLDEYNRLKEIENQSKTDGFIFLENENEELKKKVNTLNWNIFYIKENHNRFTGMLIDEKKELKRELDLSRKDMKKLNAILKRINNNFFLKIIFDKELNL